MSLARTNRRARAAALLAGALLAAAPTLLAPPAAGAVPGTVQEAEELVEQTAQQLTVLDEQVHEAQLIVEDQQRQADAAAEAAAVAQTAVDAYEPQLRAIAHSGYTGTSRSRVAAFLTSDSATDLVQQITTLDLIATHTESVIAGAATAQDEALEAQQAADEAAATARAGLAELERQRTELQAQQEEYEATFERLGAQERARVTAAVAGPTLAAPSADELPVAPGSAAAVAIETALAKVGSPYQWGSTGPNSFDCSGLTGYAYAAAGISLPHSSRAQSGLGRAVSRAELQPGDLVFYYSPISHVGLYIGNGMMVHARTYGQPVAVTSVDQSGYVTARRIVG